jgi:hypothetical protein
MYSHYYCSKRTQEWPSRPTTPAKGALSSGAYYHGNIFTEVSYHVRWQRQDLRTRCGNIAACRPPLVPRCAPFASTIELSEPGSSTSRDPHCPVTVLCSWTPMKSFHLKDPHCLWLSPAMRHSTQAFFHQTSKQKQPPLTPRVSEQTSRTRGGRNQDFYPLTSRRNSTSIWVEGETTTGTTGVSGSDDCHQTPRSINLKALRSRTGVIVRASW